MGKYTGSFCDLCSNRDEAQQYEIKSPEGVLRLDLCEDCALPLKELQSRAPKALFTRAGQRRRASKIVVDPTAI